METNNLSQNSKDLCKMANEVIQRTNVMDVFSKLGKVEIIGSLKLGLMFRRDIDLLVISDDIDKAKAEGVTKKFLDSGLFQTVGFANYQTFPANDMPLGFYWELIVANEDQNWKFDVWYLKPDEKYTHMVFEALEKFGKLLLQNPEKAETILKIKQAYFDGVKYKDNVKSIDIYLAVLEKGVASVSEFANLIKKSWVVGR